MEEKDFLLIHMSDRSNSELSVYQYGRHKCEPEKYYGPAKRDYFLLHYIIRGKGIFQKGGNTYNLGQNQIFLIQPEEETFYKADLNEPWEYYFVGFHGTACKKILSQIDCHENSIINPVDTATILNAFKNMTANVKNTTWTHYRALGELYIILSQLVKEARKNINLSERINNDDIIAKAINFIHENYALGIGINDIAKHCNIGRTSLFRKFRKELNIPPQEYILNFRLDSAATFLKETKLANYEIALLVGMQDYPNFCKMFKRQFGFTPTEFRKKL